MGAGARSGQRHPAIAGAVRRRRVGTRCGCSPAADHARVRRGDPAPHRREDPHRRAHARRRRVAHRGRTCDHQSRGVVAACGYQR